MPSNMATPAERARVESLLAQAPSPCPWYVGQWPHPVGHHWRVADGTARLRRGLFKTLIEVPRYTYCLGLRGQHLVLMTRSEATTLVIFDLASEVRAMAPLECGVRSRLMPVYSFRFQPAVEALLYTLPPMAINLAAAEFVFPLHPHGPVHAAIAVWRTAPNSLEVIPLAWFNAATYDLGYEWITRIARHPERAGFVGDGIRVGPFETDENGGRLDVVRTVRPGL